MDTKFLKIQADTLRFLSADMIEKANSGHPGAPLGLADILSVLSYHLKHNPKNPNWLNRDRLIFSGGHASALIYSFLHLSGYDLSLDDLKKFRQLHSKTPGHPEITTPGIEIATGPLGQGVANAVGFAMAAKKAQKMLGNDLIDHKVYCLCGDGDLQEGISYEACSLAGLHKLDNLILIYDSNNISIEGNVGLAFNEDVALRFKSQGFEVQNIDGHNFEEINKALEKAKNSKQPSLIIAKTTIAKGAGKLEGSHKSHGAPLGEDIIKEAKEKIGFDKNLTFQIPLEAKIRFESAIEIGDLEEAKWKEKLKNSNKKELLEKLLQPDFSKIQYPDFKGKDLATRDSNGEILNILAKNLEGFLGGSADLGPSNKTELHNMGDFVEGKNIHFGIREHAMVAINNAFARYGLFLPFSATFFIFSEYLKPAARIAALMKIKHFFIFTHDSIGVGEDGPTHQPIEQLSTFRAMPDFLTFRPADGVENVKAWKIALNKQMPSAFVLSRQKLKALSEPVFGDVENGAYLLKENDNPKFTLLSSGSEVSLCLDVANELAKQNITCNVASMPCFELFNQQENDYKKRILQGEVIGVEAANSNELYKFCHRVYGIESFGESGKDKDVFEHFGFSVSKLLNFIINQ
ncbi:transketolase [Campylobacter molothri]|uniref:Transketolase n=1 Tax=Campylobacter molothri TaxID=1032242 RepID=A0ACC5W0W9_9BACT|nr:transketolase [Campylobacter sp. RM10537]MBZ7928115.1 transketolase [Campylobacter sp. RM10542]MBZ7930867.1 transketolase [Campylobacter sp. RM12910]MBZ7948936.1 transketolase [Campylobacter sp. RM10534]MBZ7957969.1 transketolase [Campylobacter sp. RM9760]MBZ7974105.1 transketolase [Campylobacter sp. RM9754]